MRALLESARSFAAGIVRHFWFLVPGVLLAGTDLVERVTDKSVSPPAPVVWAVLGVGVALSALLAYHDVRVAATPRLTAEAARHGIAERTQTGHEIFRRPVRTEEEYEVWGRDATEWNRETTDWLQTNLSYADAATFATPGSPMAADYVDGATFNNTHGGQRCMIA